MPDPRRSSSALVAIAPAPAPFPMAKARIVALCLVLPIAGLVLGETWRAAHPEAARFALRASWGGWALFWSVVVLGTALSG